MKHRDDAWLFATDLTKQPERQGESIRQQDVVASALGTWYLNVPKVPGVDVVKCIADHESHDVAANIAALEPVVKEPARLVHKFLRSIRQTRHRARNDVILARMGMILRAPDSDLPELDQVHSISDVLDRLDQIIQWSIDEGSSLGYFAVLYKRMTMSVRDAIIDRKFENPEKMAELDVAFAQQYFDALNAYFHSTNDARAPMVWTVAFVGHENDEVTIVQQMLTALNAHICLDLAMAALITAETSLNDLEPDFIMVNGLIASQISGVLDIVQELSPQLRKIRLLVPEVWLVRKVITDFRQLAWNFAIGMALQPENRKTLVLHQEAWSAALGAWYLSPPRLCIPFDSIINSIAKRENRDVTENIRKLAVIANEPAQLNTKYMRPMATQA